MKSILKTGPSVTFPAFMGERIYMAPFRKGSLPFSRWRKTVDTMLDGIETDEIIYLTVDEGFVQKGALHRRGGPHVDGNYSGSWDFPRPGWKFSSGGGIVLASSHVGCQAFDGVVDGQIGAGGDCSGLDLPKPTVLQPNRVHLGNASMVHETIPALEDCHRTMVRLTLPESWSLTQ